jgi:hypothetical protein
MRAPNTLSAWKIRSMVESLDQASRELDEMWTVMRRENPVLPIGVPTHFGALRAYVQIVRGHLLEAAITEVHVETSEAVS